MDLNLSYKDMDLSPEFDHLQNGFSEQEVRSACLLHIA